MRKTLTFPSGEVSYLEWAATAPPVHFTHANGFNAETYRALLTPLQGRFRVTAADQRGHGFTTLPAEPGMQTGWAVYGEDLAKVVAGLNDGPAILAGHSMGAIASMMVAAHFPERVRALVLVEPVLVPRFTWHMVRLMRLLGRPSPINTDLAALADKRRAVFPSFEMALSAYRGRGAFRSWPESVVADYLHGGLRPTGNGTEMELACAPAWEAANFRNAPAGIARLARKVRCPLTLIHADQGTARACEIAIVARVTRDARIVHVPGTTHFLPMERPDVVQDEIERIGRLAI